MSNNNTLMSIILYDDVCHNSIQQRTNRIITYTHIYIYGLLYIQMYSDIFLNELLEYIQLETRTHEYQMQK